MKGFPFFHAFQELGCLVAGSIFCTQSYFYHVIETDGFDGGKNLSRSCIELSVDSRSRNSYDFLVRGGNAFVHVDHLGTFHDRPVRTSLHTFSAIDTFIFVNMLGSVFAFGDRFHRTNILARYGRVHDCVVRADFRTQSATHAVFLRDASLPPLKEIAAFGQFIKQGRPSQPRHVFGHEVLGLHTSTTSLMNHGKNILFRVLVIKCFLCEFRQGDQVDFLVRDLEAQDRDNLMLQDVAIFMHATLDRSFYFLGAFPLECTSPHLLDFLPLKSFTILISNSRFVSIAKLSYNISYFLFNDLY